MAALDVSSFKIDSISSLRNKMDYFNNYMQELAQLNHLAARQAGRDVEGSLPDAPLPLKLIRFWPKDISGVPVLPFIALPINPHQFKVVHKKKSDVIYTLGGFVINHWHDDVTTITATGYLPSFGGRAKALTTSYQFGFLPLLNMYKSCGQIATTYRQSVTTPSLDRDKLTRDAGKTKDNNLPNVGYSKGDSTPSDTLTVSGNALRNAHIDLYYQHDVYTGIFTDFTIDETYEQPNTLLYSFTFKAFRSKNVVIPNLLEETSKLGKGNPNSK